MREYDGKRLNMCNIIIKWANDNAGAITGIATLLLAILTFIYVILTYRLAKQAKRQADLMHEEKNLALKREVTETIYVPLIEELSKVKNIEGYRADPPSFTFWDDCKKGNPFLAYRINMDIQQKLESLDRKFQRFKEPFPEILQSIRDIVCEIFDRNIASIHSRKIVFWNEDNSYNHMPATLILRRTLYPEVTLGELFKSNNITCVFGAESIKLPFDDFKKYWELLEEKIKNDTKLTEHLQLFKDIIKTTQDLETTIKKEIEK